MSASGDRGPEVQKRPRPILDWADRDVVFTTVLALLVVGGLASSVMPEKDSLPAVLASSLLIWFAALGFSIGVIGFIRRCRGGE